MSRTPFVSRLPVAFFLLLAQWMAPAAGHAGTTYYVATTGSDSAGTAGTNWGTAFLTISNAVKKAKTNGDVVLVSNGTYNITAQISITNGITVRSWNNGALDRVHTVVRRSSGAARIFYIHHASALVEGFTLANAQMTAQYSYGAGAHIDNGGTLRDCIVTNNSATANYSDGAGVAISGSGLVDDCVIVRNSGWRSGGVALRGGGVVSHSLVAGNTNTYTVSPNGGGGGIRITGGGTATWCTVSGNLGNSDGGGIFLQTGTVSHCTVVNNTSLRYGGGLTTYLGGNSHVRDCLIRSNLCESTRSGAGLFLYSGGFAENCRIEGNFGRNGGGLYLYNGGTARNCLVTGNTATNDGGGVFISGGGTVENCTFVGNFATNNSAVTARGGGLAMDVRTAGYWADIRNTILYGNTAESGANNSLPWGGTNCWYTDCCLTPLPVRQSGCFTNDPQFVNAAGGDYRPQKLSPCVDEGSNATWMDTAGDLGGGRRIQPTGGTVDIGCYEYQPLGTFITIR